MGFTAPLSPVARPFRQTGSGRTWAPALPSGRLIEADRRRVMDFFRKIQAVAVLKHGLLRQQIPSYWLGSRRHLATVLLAHERE